MRRTVGLYLLFWFCWQMSFAETAQFYKELNIGSSTAYSRNDASKITPSAHIFPKGILRPLGYTSVSGVIHGLGKYEVNHLTINRNAAFYGSPSLSIIFGHTWGHYDQLCTDKQIPTLHNHRTELGKSFLTSLFSIRTVAYIICYPFHVLVLLINSDPAYSISCKQQKLPDFNIPF